MQCENKEQQLEVLKETLLDNEYSDLMQLEEVRYELEELGYDIISIQEENTYGICMEIQNRYCDYRYYITFETIYGRTAEENLYICSYIDII